MGHTLKYSKHTNYEVSNFAPNLSKIKVESAQGRYNKKAILKENENQSLETKNKKKDTENLKVREI